MLKNPNCYRCDSKLALDPSSSNSISFFICNGCGSHYTLSQNTSLHDRWGMPLSIPLYSVIFDTNPCDRVDDVAESLKRDHLDLIPELVEDIYRELGDARQKVSEIHNFTHATETQLRDFLAKLVKRIT